MFSPEEKEYLFEIYKGRTCKEVAEMISNEFGVNHTWKEVEGFKNRNNLKSGLDFGFRKGHIPHNKGKKWDEYLTKEQQEKARQSGFKKGHMPKQHKEVGSEMIDIYGYTKVKVAEPDVWVYKQRVIYEKAYGKIPAGMRVIFADGNKQNFELKNLLLVSYKELLMLNQKDLIKESKELTESGLALVKLLNKMYENGLSEENQKEYAKKYRLENREKIREYQQKNWRKYYERKKERKNAKI